MEKWLENLGRGIEDLAHRAIAAAVEKGQNVRVRKPENRGNRGADSLVRNGILLVVIMQQFVATAAAPMADSSQHTNGVATAGIKTDSKTAIDPEHPQDDFRVHIGTNAPAATGATTNKEEGFHWEVSWRGWDGLHLALSQTTPLKTPREVLGLKLATNALTFHLDQLKMAANIGALVEVDGAAYSTTGNLDVPADIGPRRVRLIMQGGVHPGASGYV